MHQPRGGTDPDPLPDSVDRAQAIIDAMEMIEKDYETLASEGFSLSVADPDIQELPVTLYHRLVDSLAYAA